MSPADRTETGERILQTLRSVVPAPLLAVFRYCLEHAEQPLSVEQLAAACGIRRRALEYRFRRAGLPPPGTCVARCRLLLAVRHLEHHPDSIERVAQQFGFGTAGALRKSLARHFGVAPQAVRQPGAFDAAMIGLLDALRRGHNNRPHH